MDKILVVLLIGVLLRHCAAQARGDQAAASCLKQNPGGGRSDFSVIENPSPEGKCYTKCLFKAINAIRVVNAEVESVHWTWFQNLIDDPSANAGLRDCKQFIVQDIAQGLDDFCSSVLAVHKCMESRYPGTFRAAFLKYFATN